MILNLVNHLRGVFQAHADGKGFGFDFHTGVVEVSIDVSRGVSRGEYDRTFKFFSVLTDDALDSVAAQRQRDHFCLKMHLSAGSADLVAHRLYDSRQTVCADVRMSVGENVGRSTELTENAQNLFDVAAFFGAGVEFSVGVGTCAAFAERVVAFRIDAVFAGDAGDVLAPFVNVLASLQNDGAAAQFNQTQGGEESTGAGTDDNDGGSVGDVGIVHGSEVQRRSGFVDIDVHAEIDEDGSLARIDAAASNAQGLYGAGVYAPFLRNAADEAIFAVGDVRSDAEGYFSFQDSCGFAASFGVFSYLIGAVCL